MGEYANLQLREDMKPARLKMSREFVVKINPSIRA